MKILFLHVAKTGGMSIRKTLLVPHGIISFDCLHNGVIIEYRDGQEHSRKRYRTLSMAKYDYAFYFVRNPLHRVFSCYQYFIRGGLNQFQPGRYPKDQQLQQYLLDKFPTFSSCCAALEEISLKIPHFRPVSHWLHQLPDPLANHIFTGRTENFCADLHTALSPLEIDPRLIESHHLNRSSPGSSDTNLDRSARESVRGFYAEDYRLFAYQ